MIKADDADPKLRLVPCWGQGRVTLRHGNLAVGEKLKGTDHGHRCQGPIGLQAAEVSGVAAEGNPCWPAPLQWFK